MYKYEAQVWNHYVYDMRYAPSTGGFCPVLAVNSVNQLNMARSVDFGGLYHYTYNIDGTWDESYFDNAPYAGKRCKYVIDDYDNEHYFYTTHHYLRYVKVKNGKTKVVNPEEQDFRSISMATDSLGNAHVLYYDTTLQQLRYAVISW